MKIDIKKTDEVKNLLKAMGSSDESKARQGFQAFAAFVGPVADVVFKQKNLIDGIYRTASFDFDEEPSIPIPPFYANTEGLFDIWSNSVEGGLAYNEVYGQDDYRFRTMRLDSALAFPKEYLRAAKLNQFQLTIERLFDEILVKRNYYAWQVLMAALGGARYNGVPNVISSYAKTNSLTRNLLPEDFSKLQTFHDLLRPSWVGGTVDGEIGGITDMFMSPQGFEKLRAWAYNPVNTVAGVTSDTGTEVGSTVGIPLTDSMREQIFRGGNTGTFEYQGVIFHKLLELGPDKQFTRLFDTYYTAAGSDPTFASATEDIVIGLNRNSDAFWRATVAGEGGENFTLLEDNQFSIREDKVGYYGFIKEGWTVLDTRSICGIVW